MLKPFAKRVLCTPRAVRANDTTPSTLPALRAPVRTGRLVSQSESRQSLYEGELEGNWWSGDYAHGLGQLTVTLPDTNDVNGNHVAITAHGHFKKGVMNGPDCKITYAWEDLSNCRSGSVTYSGPVVHGLLIEGEKNWCGLSDPIWRVEVSAYISRDLGAPAHFFATMHRLARRADPSGRLLAALHAQSQGDTDPGKLALSVASGKVVLHLRSSRNAHGKFGVPPQQDDCLATGLDPSHFNFAANLSRRSFISAETENSRDNILRYRRLTRRAAPQAASARSPRP